MVRLIIWLVVEPPLWTMMDFVTWDDDIPHWMEKLKCSKPPTSKKICRIKSKSFGHTMWLAVTAEIGFVKRLDNASFAVRTNPPKSPMFKNRDRDFTTYFFRHQDFWTEMERSCSMSNFFCVWKTHRRENYEPLVTSNDPHNQINPSTRPGKHTKSYWSYGHS